MLGLIGCSRGSLPPPDVVATLGEEPVSYSAFEGYLVSSAPDTEGALDGDVLSVLFDEFLTEQLLNRLAVERLGPSAEGSRDAIEKLALVSTPATVGRAEMETYYFDHQAEFQLPERIDLGQILVAEVELATATREQLLSGNPFDRLVTETADDPAVAQAWLQRGVERTHLPPAFADEVFSLPTGGVSEVVSAEYGYMIFQVLERYPSETLTFEAAAPMIADVLRGRQAERILEALVSEAKERYNVEVFERNLPFAYIGSYRTESS